MERFVRWGGDPTKAVSPDPTTGRLSPRHSFQAWGERVEGHSAPWREADRSTALEIRRTITTALAREAIAELAKLRHYDPLTQPPNRRLLQKHLDALRTQRDVALLFLDLDRFKSVNDTHGHSAGDSLLLQVSTRIGNVVRQGDLVARVGGDEFVIFCLKISPVAGAVPWRCRSTSPANRSSPAAASALPILKPPGPPTSWMLATRQCMLTRERGRSARHRRGVEGNYAPSAQCA
jgi:GGDEF domain-containing protein